MKMITEDRALFFDTEDVDYVYIGQTSAADVYRVLIKVKGEEFELSSHSSLSMAEKYLKHYTNQICAGEYCAILQDPIPLN